MSFERLLDPAVLPRQKETASIEALIHMIDPSDAVLSREAKRRLKALRTACKDIRALRHREGAHRDRPTVWGTHPAR